MVEIERLDLTLMNTTLKITEILEIGKIKNELDFERALIVDRKLRTLAKENSKYKPVRKNLRELIEDYEKKNWSDKSTITDEKLEESDLAELIAEKERKFIFNRKKLIRKKLKKLNLTQQDLGRILGHNSKSYISELMNGLSPFSLKDIILLNQLLKIDLNALVPTFISQSDRDKIKATIEKLDNPKLILSKYDDFAIV